VTSRLINGDLEADLINGFVHFGDAFVSRPAITDIFVNAPDTLAVTAEFLM
jgi:hypothetical protein